MALVILSRSRGDSLFPCLDRLVGGSDDRARVELPPNHEELVAHGFQNAAAGIVVASGSERRCGQERHDLAK